MHSLLPLRVRPPRSRTASHARSGPFLTTTTFCFCSTKHASYLKNEFIGTRRCGLRRVHRSAYAQVRSITLSTSPPRERYERSFARSQKRWRCRRILGAAALVTLGSRGSGRVSTTNHGMVPTAAPKLRSRFRRGRSEQVEFLEPLTDNSRRDSATFRRGKIAHQGVASVSGLHDGGSWGGDARLERREGAETEHSVDREDGAKRGWGLDHPAKEMVCRAREVHLRLHPVAAGLRYERRGGRIAGNTGDPNIPVSEVHLHQPSTATQASKPTARTMEVAGCR